MPEPSQEEINESIKELSTYRNRLKKELITITQKLHMSEKKINNLIKDHMELKKIDKTIEKLKLQVKSN